MMMDVISMNLGTKKMDNELNVNENNKAHNTGNSNLGQTNNKNQRKKVKRPDAANEVISIEKKLGLKNDLIVKSNMYSLVGLILVVCGLSAPIFILFGVAAEAWSIKIMLGSECKRQKLWHKCIVYYAKGMYNQAKVLSTRLSEEDRKGEAYKLFINMVDKAISSNE